MIFLREGEKPDVPLLPSGEKCRAKARRRARRRSARNAGAEGGWGLDPRVTSPMMTSLGGLKEARGRIGEDWRMTKERLERIGDPREDWRRLGSIAGRAWTKSLCHTEQLFAHNPSSPPSSSGLTPGSRSTPIVRAQGKHPRVKPEDATPEALGKRAARPRRAAVTERAVVARARV